MQITAGPSCFYSASMKSIIYYDGLWLEPESILTEAGIEATAPFVVAYNKFNPNVTIPKYLPLLSPVRFSRLPDKVEKERVREKNEEGGWKEPLETRPDEPINIYFDDQTGAKIEHYYGVKTDRGNPREDPKIYYATRPLWIFDISCSTGENYSSLDRPPLNELPVNSLTTHHEARSWFRPRKFHAISCPIEIRGKKSWNAYLIETRTWSKEIWKIETGSGSIRRFLEQRESLATSSESENVPRCSGTFLPTIRKENLRLKLRNIHNRKKCVQVMFHRNKPKNQQIFIFERESLSSESYLAVEHMLRWYFFLNEMQVKHKLLYIGPGSSSSLVNVEAPLIPEPNQTSARQRLSGGSGSTS